MTKLKGVKLIKQIKSTIILIIAKNNIGIS